MEEKRRNVGCYFSFVLTASVSRVREIGSAPLGVGGMHVTGGDRVTFGTWRINSMPIWGRGLLLAATDK